jgi:hypothetical protein
LQAFFLVLFFTRRFARGFSIGSRTDFFCQRRQLRDKKRDVIHREKNARVMIARGGGGYLF